MKRRGFLISLLVFGCLLASGAWAKVQVNNVSLSTQILIEAYRASQNKLSSINWANPSVIMLAATSDAATAGRNLTFNLQIFDGNTQVLSLGSFQVKPRLLAVGNNIFNANDIASDQLTVSFNQNYAPSVNGGSLSQGNPMPLGNYRILLTPVAPTPGEPYVMSLALFTPPSALNLPPMLIYPKDVEVNTVLPSFSWTPVNKAVGYELSVGPEPNPEVNAYWKSGRVNATQALYAASARALGNGVKYYWQVRAFDSLGNPIGGVDGKSQPASFTVNSSNHATTALAPGDVETILKSLITDPTIFPKLAAYSPVGIETSAADLADLLQQLKNGTAKIISASVE